MIHVCEVRNFDQIVFHTQSRYHRRIISLKICKVCHEDNVSVIDKPNSTIIYNDNTQKVIDFYKDSYTQKRLWSIGTRRRYYASGLTKPDENDMVFIWDRFQRHWSKIIWILWLGYDTTSQMYI